MAIEDIPLVDSSALAQTRVELGANFVRILGYFREDGVKSVSAIESAVRAQSAAAMVMPAHTLKGESRQFGAEPLAALAERIEMIGRACVERHDTPTDAIELVVKLRPLFEATLSLLEREANSLTPRRPAAFGRRAAGGFGR